MALVFVDGAQTSCDTVEVREGLIYLDGKELSRAGGIIVHIHGNVSTVVASGSACVVVSGDVGAVTTARDVGAVVSGGGTHVVKGPLIKKKVVHDKSGGY